MLNGLEKSTCAPNIHEQAFVQGVETNLLNVRGGLGNKQGVPNNIKTELEDFFRCRINDFGRQLVPRLDKAARKSKLATCQMGQLMAKFEVMATKIWICWRLEGLINGEVHPPMEYVILKTESTRNHRWTNNGRPRILSRRSNGKCKRPFTSRVTSFWRSSVRSMSFCRYGDTA